MSFYVGMVEVVGRREKESSFNTRTTLCINDEANCEKKKENRKNSFSHIGKIVKKEEVLVVKKKVSSVRHMTSDRKKRQSDTKRRNEKKNRSRMR